MFTAQRNTIKPSDLEVYSTIVPLFDGRYEKTKIKNLIAVISKAVPVSQAPDSVSMKMEYEVHHSNGARAYFKFMEEAVKFYNNLK